MLAGYGKSRVPFIYIQIPLLHEADLIQYLSCIGEKFISLCGDRHPFIRPVKNRHLHLLLQFPDCIGKTRLGNEQLFCRLTYRPLLRNHGNIP